MKKISIVFLLITLIISCNENLSPDDYQEISVKNLYKLSVPKYMFERDDLNSEASLQYANLLKEAYTVVVHESKQDFIGYSRTTNTYNEQLSVLENYSQNQINFFENNQKLKRFEASNFTKVNELNTRQVKLKGTANGNELGYIISFIEGEHNLYMIMNWTRLNRLERFDNTFKTINNSFKLIKN
ncbi:MAG TPA: hypothetical protein DDZ39_09240 [Flavobacteriaceae bacterium]|jgi:hypothetical protein|nr:hypothetical protein [Flavobacteriaceae bacterium]HBS11194.1 hypothetical protein [Flavobacteriaceae bacterium]